MKNLPWCRFFYQDWMNGVGGLSAAERGVYMMLLCMMYDAGGPILHDDGRLARRCGLPVMPFRRALAVLIEEGKITVEDGRLFNDRVKDEVANALEYSVAMKEKAALRWDKKKEKQHSNSAQAMPTQCQSQSQSQVVSNDTTKRAPRAAAGEVKEVLSACLPPDLADALIAHRKAKKSPLSTYAARLLVKQFQDYGNPVAAAEAMIANGWQGFKPDWMARAGPRIAPASQTRGGPARLLNELNRIARDEQETLPPKTLELLSFPSRNFG